MHLNLTEAAPVSERRDSSCFWMLGDATMACSRNMKLVMQKRNDQRYRIGLSRRPTASDDGTCTRHQYHAKWPLAIILFGRVTHLIHITGRANFRILAVMFLASVWLKSTSSLFAQFCVSYFSFFISLFTSLSWFQQEVRIQRKSTP